MDNEITCILTLYKRPENLAEQLEALKNQTVKAKEIIIINNGQFYSTPEEYKKKYTVIDSTINRGVWFRFTVALNAKTKYVCIIDDDTIPGSKRFESCLHESEKKRGLYGTIGCIYGVAMPQYKKTSPDWFDIKTRKERYYSHRRRGWADNNEKTEEVDLIGHSWFFEREFLSEAYFREPIDPKYRMCGEDIHFSYALQKYMKLGSYVPPHPKDDKEMRGSKKGREMGTKKSSRAEHQGGDDDVYDTYYRMTREKGFKCLIERR